MDEVMKLRLEFYAFKIIHSRFLRAFINMMNFTYQTKPLTRRFKEIILEEKEFVLDKAPTSVLQAKDRELSSFQEYYNSLENISPEALFETERRKLEKIYQEQYFDVSVDFADGNITPKTKNFLLGI